MAKRYNRAMRRVAQNISETPRQVVTVQPGTVDGVTAGAAADGNAAVTVTVGSTTGIPAPYLDAYTPHVGDTVTVLLVDGSPLILGQPIGLPVV